MHTPPTLPEAEATVQFVDIAPDPEPTLGGLVLTPEGLTGDPAVLIWVTTIGQRMFLW